MQYIQSNIKHIQQEAQDALCQTICGAILIFAMVPLLFYFEMNYVTEIERIEAIKAELIQVSAYDPKNDGKPVVYTGTTSVLEPLRDNKFGLEIPDAIKGKRIGMIYAYAKENNKTISKWTSFVDTAENPGNTRFQSPCDKTTCAATLANDINFVDSEFIIKANSALMKLFEPSKMQGFPIPKSYKPSGAFQNCGSQLRYPSCAQSSVIGDQYVAFEYASSGGKLSVCTRQKKGKTFGALDEYYDFDIIQEKKLTRESCIETLTNNANSTLYVSRIVSFLGFWLGFFCLCSVLHVFTPEFLEGSLDCIICIVQFAPACCCWTFWFGLAWMFARPLIGSIFLVVSIGLIIMLGCFVSTNKPSRTVMQEGGAVQASGGYQQTPSQAEHEQFQMPTPPNGGYQQA